MKKYIPLLVLALSNHGIFADETNLPPSFHDFELRDRLAQGSPATLRMNLDQLQAMHERIKKDHNKLHNAFSGRPKVLIYMKGENHSLDFEKRHTSMLESYSTAVSWEVDAQANLRRIEALSKEFQDFEPSAHQTGSRDKTEHETDLGLIHDKLGREVDKTLANCLELKKSISDYKDRINETLVQEIHRYQLTIEFRKKIGQWWLWGFLGLCGALLLLGWVKVKNMPKGSYLQLVAMLVILTALAFFGITGVMGENGVTGLLAALAGYILGKGSNGEHLQNLPQIIAAAQGRAPEQRRQTDANDRDDT